MCFHVFKIVQMVPNHAKHHIYTFFYSHTYFLCEVTVTEDGLIKQRRLPDNASNLANRISLNGRYYIKSSIAEGPISDEVAQVRFQRISFKLLKNKTRSFESHHLFVTLLQFCAHNVILSPPSLHPLFIRVWNTEQYCMVFWPSLVIRDSRRYPGKVFPFKVNSSNSRETYEIYSELTIKKLHL